MKLADSQTVSLRDLQSQVVRAGHAYWLAKCNGRPFPARADLDPPIEIPRLSANIVLLAVQHEPLDFEYRLIGERVRRRMGENFTGKRMSQVPYQCAPNPMWRQHQWSVEQRRPRLFRPDYIGKKEDFAFVEVAVLPLGTTPDRVDALMAFVDFVRKPA